MENNLGVAWSMLGRTDEARSAFSEAIRLDPAQPDGYDNLAQLELKAGNVPRACEIYERARRQDPPADLLLGAAEVFSEAGRPEEAGKALDAALRKDPDNVDVAEALGSWCAQQGDRDRAVRLLRQAAAAGSKSAEETLRKVEAGR